MSANRLYLEFNDRLGKAAKTLLYIAAAITDPNSATVQAIRTAVVAILKALNPSAGIAIASSIAGTAGTADYATVEDKALMVFKDSNGKRHSYRVPGPKKAIFQSDNETVNPANASVATYISAMLANVVTRDGAPLSSFLYGRRIMTKIQRQ